MCGITGILKKADKNWNNVNISTLKKMSLLLAHRGPDDGQTLALGDCLLGHRRLKIIDLSQKASQPMLNEDRSVAIVFNGEITNFLELKKMYFTGNQKHIFKSSSDTEVILHLYEEYGLDAFNFLNGMFSVAIWDKNKQKLILARDRFGIKPLFYLFYENHFFFSSEIKSLLEVPGFPVRPSLDGLNCYLTMGYFPGESTAYAQISRLLPGHVLEISSDDLKFKKVKYVIDYPKDNNTISFKKAIAETEALFFNSIKRHLISDVPLGVTLSGGLDSSGIAAFVKKAYGHSAFHTFAITFSNNSTYDEASYSRLVAKKLGTIHHEIDIDKDKVLDSYPGYLAYIDEPNSDGSAIPLYLLAKEAAQYVTVLLLGDGADEYFGGYDTYIAYKLRKFFNRLPLNMREIMKGILVNSLPVSFTRGSKEYVIKKFLLSLNDNVSLFHHDLRSYINGGLKQKMFNSGLINNYNISQDLFMHSFNMSSLTDELSKLMEIDQRYHLPDKIEVHSDRMTMASSLEGRMPFLDIDLIAYVNSLPVDYKIKGFSKKHILKNVFSGYLPKKIIKKKKIGLNTPTSAWLRKELRDMAEEAFSCGKKNMSDIFDFVEIDKVWQQHLSGKVNHGYFLWALINYFSWHEMYIVKKNYSKFLYSPRAAR